MHRHHGGGSGGGFVALCLLTGGGLLMLAAVWRLLISLAEPPRARTLADCSDAEYEAWMRRTFGSDYVQTSQS